MKTEETKFSAHTEAKKLMAAVSLLLRNYELSRKDATDVAKGIVVYSHFGHEIAVSSSGTTGLDGHKYFKEDTVGFCFCRMLQTANIPHRVYMNEIRAGFDLQ